MASRSYLVGYQPTKSDLQLVAAIGKTPDQEKYPHLFRYYQHISAIPAARAASLPAGVPVASGAPIPAAATTGAAAGAGAPARKPAAADSDDDDDDDDDDGDLFGGDDDDDEGLEAANKAAAEKKKKGKKPEKSAVIYEIKPLEAGQDMAELERRVREVQKDGLVWGEEFKVEDVAFGIQKLVVQAIIEDDKVDLADIETPIEEMEDIVQSIDMLGMSKV